MWNELNCEYAVNHVNDPQSVYKENRRDALNKKITLVSLLYCEHGLTNSNAQYPTIANWNPINTTG